MQVVRRRVLRCSGDRVIGIEDDLLDAEHARGDLAVIGEGALLAALSRARGHTMRDIVATIQTEQDEAIRAPYQGFTMISGGPGTARPWSPCTARPTCSTPTGGASSPAGARRRARATRS
jgi:hypothetical protein